MCVLFCRQEKFDLFCVGLRIWAIRRWLLHHFHSHFQFDQPAEMRKAVAFSFASILLATHSPSHMCAYQSYSRLITDCSMSQCIERNTQAKLFFKHFSFNIWHLCHFLRAHRFYINIEAIINASSFDLDARLMFFKSMMR